MLQLTLSKTDTFGTAPADCSSKRGDRFIENRGNNNNSKLTLKLQLFAINNCTYLFNKTVKTVIFSRKVGGAPLRATIFILQPGLMVYFNTNKTWTFFSCRIPVVLKIRRSSLVVLVRLGGGGLPTLHSTPRSDPPLAHPANWRNGTKYQSTICNLLSCTAPTFLFWGIFLLQKALFKCPLFVLREVSFLKKSRITENQQKTRGILVISLGKPEILVEKSNGLHHSVWKSSENMGCDFGR